MRLEVEAALAPLVGKSLWAWTYAAGMAMFQIGAKMQYVARFGPRKGQGREVGEYALHVQCRWRLSGPAGRVTDDEREGWVAAGPYGVGSVHADDDGGFLMVLDREHRLEVSVERGSEYEQWRLLTPEIEGPARRHFVMTGAGIER